MTTAKMTPPRAPGRLPLLGHTVPLLMRRIDFTSSLRQYGDIVEVYLGPQPSYMLTEKELAHQVLVTDARNYERGKTFDMVRPFVGDGLATSNGARHHRQRRLMQPAFHRQEVARYVAGMVGITTDMVDSWPPGETRPINEDMQLLASSVIGRTLFSGTLDGQALHELQRCVTVLVGQSFLRAMSPAVIGTLPLPVNRRYDQAVEHVRRVVREAVANRRAYPDDHRDLLSMLMTARHEDTGDGMTDEEIHDEVVTLFTAGVETTARALAWLFHEIGQRPDIEARLLAEFEDVLGGEPITVDSVSRLTYTRQVINEVLRHYAIWLLMRRTTADVELGGVRLAAGTEIMISPYALHHDPSNFPDPDRFDPGRWSPDRANLVPRNAFIPFAVGMHQCIGNTFALIEMAVVIATVLTRVHLEPVPGKPVRVKVISLPTPSRLPMTVVPRGNSNSTVTDKSTET